MKFWTCAMCGEPSDYDFCDECEDAVRDRYRQDPLTDLERKQYYDEQLDQLRQQQQGPS